MLQKQTKRVSVTALLAGPAIVCLAVLATTATAEVGFQTRAIWVDPPSFASRQAADAMVERCHRAGLNTLLVNVMYGRSVSFRSDHFPGDVKANGNFDPLGYVVQQAHKCGMKVEAWCCVYYEGAHDNGTPPLRPEWFVRSMSGHPFAQDFLSPSIPGVNEYLLSIIKDTLAYDIDGIHLDYIRYPGTTFDYSPAGRREFAQSQGFDPMDFLDHADRIVGEDPEPYPVRVLFPNDHVAKAWEPTHLERTLDQTGFGYAFISENPANIEGLATPGLLILSTYPDPPPAMIRAIVGYVERGGDVLWTDAPSTAIARSQKLRSLLGVSAAKWIGQRTLTLKSESNHPLARTLNAKRFLTASSFNLTPAGGEVIARTSAGEPVAVVSQPGGRVVLLGFHLMKSTSPDVVAISRGVIDWLREQPGVTRGADPLAAKRAAWVQWRADCVTNLVRDVHEACQEKSAETLVSSSGGPSRAELFACYRDARRWLAEGINDRVFPMNYTDNVDDLRDKLRVQVSATPAGKQSAIYPGLKMYRVEQVDGRPTSRPQQAETLKAQLAVVKEYGYQGYALFAYNSLSDELVNVLADENRATAE